MFEDSEESKHCVENTRKGKRKTIPREKKDVMEGENNRHRPKKQNLFRERLETGDNVLQVRVEEQRKLQRREKHYKDLILQIAEGTERGRIKLGSLIEQHNR